MRGYNAKFSTLMTPRQNKLAEKLSEQVLSDFDKSLSDTSNSSDDNKVKSLKKNDDIFKFNQIKTLPWIKKSELIQNETFVDKRLDLITKAYVTAKNIERQSKKNR